MKELFVPTLESDVAIQYQKMKRDNFNLQFQFERCKLNTVKPSLGKMILRRLLGEWGS